MLLDCILVWTISDERHFFETKRGRTAKVGEGKDRTVTARGKGKQKTRAGKRPG